MSKKVFLWALCMLFGIVLGVVFCMMLRFVPVHFM